MATPIPEAAVVAVFDRLAAIVTAAIVERDRRAPVDTDAEPLPRLIVALETLEADTTQEPGYTHYQIGLAIIGYAAGDDDTLATQALHTLHAQVVAALAGWTPDTEGLGDLALLGADFTLFDAEQSARPAGDFVTRFSMLAHAPTGNPYL